MYDRFSLVWEKYSHVDVEAEVVGGAEEVIANNEVEHKQDEDEENLQSERDEVVEGDEDEEGHLVDYEDCPGDFACQKLGHFHSEPGSSCE